MTAKKITKVVATTVSVTILLLSLSSLAIAQEELRGVFRDNMVSRYGKEAYIEFEQRMDRLRRGLAEERMLERTKKDATFILMYARMWRWLREGYLQGPAAEEAVEFLEENLDRFIDSSENILNQAMITAVLMEDSGVDDYLDEYLYFIWEIARSEEVKELLVEKETEILVQMGYVASDSRELLERPQEPIHIVKSETIRIVLSKYSKDRVEKAARDDAWRKELIVSVAELAGGTGLLVGDLTAGVPLSAPFAAHFIGKGLDRLISLFK